MLVGQPLADQLPVQVGGGHRAGCAVRALCRLLGRTGGPGAGAAGSAGTAGAGLTGDLAGSGASGEPARPAQPVLVQVGDERQQPRVVRQIGEVPHLLDQGQAVRRQPPRLGTAGAGIGQLLGQRPVVTPDQEIMDLPGGELGQPDDVPAERARDLLPGLLQHLVVGQEELGPARHEDLRLAGGRRGIGAGPAVEGVQQGVQVLHRAFVGDAGGELVEAVADQHQPAPAQHVAEGVQVRPADRRLHQMLGDELVELQRLLQPAQLDQHRVHVRQVAGQLQGELVGEEGLAVPGLAEHEDEPGLVRGQPLDDLVEGGAGHCVGHCARHSVGRAADTADALRHVQLGRVVHVGTQPDGLPADVVAQVQHTLVFGPTQQRHAEPLGVGDQARRGLRPGVDEVGEHARVGGQVAVPDGPRELVDPGRVRVAVEQADDPVLGDAPLGAPQPQMGGRPAVSRRLLDPIDPRVRMAQAGHLGDLVQQVGWPRPGRLAVAPLAGRAVVVQEGPVGRSPVREAAVPAPAGAVPSWLALPTAIPRRARERRVHGPELVPGAHRPGAAGRVDPRVARPASLVRLVAAGVPGEPGPVDADQLVLVRHLGRPGGRGGRRAARGHHRQPGDRQRAGPAVVGVTVQEQVQVGPEDPVQVVGVAQVLVVRGRAADRVVVHLAPIRSQPSRS